MYLNQLISKLQIWQKAHEEEYKQKTGKENVDVKVLVIWGDDGNSHKLYDIDNIHPSNGFFEQPCSDLIHKDFRDSIITISTVGVKNDSK